MTEDPEPWFPLRTARLLLREFREGDFEDVQSYAQDPKVARYMEWGPNSRDDTAEFFRRKFEEQALWPRDAAGLAVELVAERRVIGSVRLSVTSRADRTGDIGYSFHSAYWRRGYATEAAGALLAAGFERLGLHRIFAECDVRNRGSWGVMQKLGMRREGRLRDGRRIKGVWRDRYLYALLATDPRPGAVDSPARRA